MFGIHYDETSGVRFTHHTVIGIELGPHVKWGEIALARRGMGVEQRRAIRFIKLTTGLLFSFSHKKMAKINAQDIHIDKYIHTITNTHILCC